MILSKAFDRKHKTSWKKIIHITSQNLRDFFLYHIFTTLYLFLYALFFGHLGVAIHIMTTNKYHMGVTTLVSRKKYVINDDVRDD
jgi:hypothetical protein